MMKKALLVIDVQNDYFDGGKYPLVEPQKALAKINLLERYFLDQALPIIYIQHINETGLFFIKETLGCELHPQLLIQGNSLVTTKHFPNSFLETNLLTLLKIHAVKELVITGMMTHMCVDSTTRAAKDLGFNNILICDAVATSALEFEGQVIQAQEVQIAYLSALQKFAHITTVEKFLAI